MKATECYCVVPKWQNGGFSHFAHDTWPLPINQSPTRHSELVNDLSIQCLPKHGLPPFSERPATPVPPSHVILASLENSAVLHHLPNDCPLNPHGIVMSNSNGRITQL